MTTVRGRTSLQRLRRVRWWALWLASSLLVVLVSGILVLWRLHLPPRSASSMTPIRSELVLPSPSAEPAQIEGGTFRKGIIGRIETLNPLLADSTAEAAVSVLVFEGLVWVDGSGVPQPALAERWTMSDDGLEYTFFLRPDAQWHDGEPVTARDVLFTIRLLQDPRFPGTETMANFWRTVTVEVVDAESVRFRLPEPYAPFPTYLSLPILPEHVLAGTVVSDLLRSRFESQPIGSGPYRVVRVDRERGVIELARHESYRRPTPLFERVELHFFESVDEALAAFRRGDLDAVDLVPWGALGDPKLMGSRVRIYAPLLAGYTALFLNSQAQFFADVRVRQALSLAIDRVQLVRDVLNNWAEPGNGPIPPASWAHQAQEYRFDRAAALSLLREAGWEDRNGDGVLDKEGLTFRFTLLTNVDDPQRVAVAQALGQQLAEIGISVTVQPVAAATLQRQLLNREYTAAVFGWMSLTGDPDMFEFWHSSQAEEGANIAGFRSRTIDVLLEKARQVSDQDERRSLYVELQRLFAEYVPAIVLYYPRYCFVMSDRIGGVDAAPLIRPEDHLRQLPRWYRIAG